MVTHWRLVPAHTRGWLKLIPTSAVMRRVMRRVMRPVMLRCPRVLPLQSPFVCPVVVISPPEVHSLGLTLDTAASHAAADWRQVRVHPAAVVIVIISSSTPNHHRKVLTVSPGVLCFTTHPTQANTPRPAPAPLAVVVTVMPRALSAVAPMTSTRAVTSQPRHAPYP